MYTSKIEPISRRNSKTEILSGDSLEKLKQVSDSAYDQLMLKLERGEKAHLASLGAENVSSATALANIKYKSTSGYILHGVSGQIYVFDVIFVRVDNRELLVNRVTVKQTY